MSNDSRSTIAAALLLLTLLAPGCKTTGDVASVSAWSPAYTPPATLQTPRMHLEPLTPTHAQLDYVAFMSSRDHLHRTMHWGSWPRADMTVEENRSDLQRHEREFVAREAYAYAVLVPDRTQSLGCVYINPVTDEPTEARVAFWVTEAALAGDLDMHLLSSLLLWLDSDWPFDAVFFLFHVDNVRGIQLAELAGLAPAPTDKQDHVAFVWRR